MVLKPVNSVKIGPDRLVVRTLRCGRNNPGSNPGLDKTDCFLKPESVPQFGQEDLSTSFFTSISPPTAASLYFCLDVFATSR